MMVRTLVVLVLMGATVRAQTLAPDESERLIAALGVYERLLAGQPDLWPEFDARATPIVVYRPRGFAIVVGHPSPPPGRVMALGAREARVVTAPAEWFGGGPTDWGGVAVARLDPRWLDEDALVIVAGLAAEAFRSFQYAKLSGAEREPDPAAVFEYPDDDVQNDAGLAIEEALLREALAGDAARYWDRGRELCDLRRVRRGRQSRRSVTFEDHVEFSQGLPAYVGVKALQAAARAGLVDEAAMTNAIPLWLGQTGEGDSIGLRLRRDAARVALLLDGLGDMSRHWKAEIASGTTLERVLREGVKSCAGERVARQRLGWTRLLAESQRRNREEWKRREIAWGQVEAAGGRGVLAVDLAPFSDVGVQHIDFTTAKRIDSDRRLHRRLRVDLGVVGNLAWDVATAETRPSQRYAVRLPKDAKVTVDGRVVRLDRSLTKPFVELAIDGEDLQAEIHGGLLHVENGGLRVRPFPRRTPR